MKNVIGCLALLGIILDGYYLYASRKVYMGELGTPEDNQ